MTLFILYGYAKFILVLVFLVGLHKAFHQKIISRFHQDDFKVLSGGTEYYLAFTDVFSTLSNIYDEAFRS